MRRWVPATVLLVGVLLDVEASAQTARVAIDCTAPQLDSVAREICDVPALRRQNDAIDALTSRLELTLTGSDRAALVDTEGPFVVERNDCRNRPNAVRECVVRAVERRLTALTAASSDPGSIRGEITQYSFLTVSFFQKYADQLVGRRVRVFGCMTLAPAPTVARRTAGTISETCARTAGPSVAAIFRSMSVAKATGFYDAKRPTSYWEGTVERRDGGLVLAQIDP